MDFSRLCINCMKEKEPEQNICPHCHFDQSTYVMPPYVLTPYTVLNGRYLVGKVLGKGGFGITYIAMDMMLERVVAIKEFFVQGYMYRDNSTSTSNAKSKLVAGLLGIFLGTFGVHNFYLGYTGKAITQLVLTIVGYILCCVVVGVFLVIGIWIWSLVEAIMILTGKINVDGKGNPLAD